MGKVLSDRDWKQNIPDKEKRVNEGLDWRDVGMSRNPDSPFGL